MRLLLSILPLLCALPFVQGQDSVHHRMQKLFPDVPDTYFIILANTSISINTAAPAIIMKINQILESQHCQHIYLVYGDDVGVGEKYFTTYLAENIFKYLKDHRSLPFIVDHEAYGAMGPRPNPSLLFVNQQQLALRLDAKYDDLPAYLPCQKMKLMPREEVVYIDKDSFQVNLLSYYYRLDDFRFIELSDFNNRMGILHVETGKFERVFDHQSLQGVDLYSRYISRDTADVTVAGFFDQYLHSVNRLSLNFEHVSVDARKQLLVSGSTSIGVKAPKNLSYRDDVTGKKQVIRKGELVGMYFPFLLRMDSAFTFNVEEIYFYNPLEDNPKLEKKHSFLPNFFVADLGNNEIVSYCEPKRPGKFKGSSPSFMTAQLYKNKIVPQKWLPARMPLDVLEKDYYLEYVRVFQRPDRHSFVLYQPDGRFFSLTENSVLGQLYDCCPASVETFPSYVYEDRPTQLRHYIFDANFIYNGQYFAVAFQNFDRTFLQLFSPDLKSIQVLDLTDLPWKLHDPLMKSIILLETKVICLLKEGDEIRIRQFDLQTQ